MSILKIDHLKKSFGDKVVLNDISLSVDHPGLYLLYGVSGCGKTTLLHMIAGFMKPDSGSVMIQEDIQPAYSFQESELLPDFTVKENIELVQRFHSEKVDIDTIVQELNIAHLMQRYPHECSQGQKNRIALARALSKKAPLILVDEPTEALDEDNRNRVKRLLQQEAQNSVVIAVTHDREWIESAHASVYELKYQRLTCIRSNETKETLKPSIPKITDNSFLQNIMKRIMKLSMKINGWLFLLLSMLITILSILPSFLFSYEYRNQSLNADVIYIDRGFSQTKFSYSEAEVIPSFDTLPFKGKRYKIRLYPLIENTAKLPITGKDKVNGYEIIINQNTAAVLAEAQGVETDELLNQTIAVPFRLRGTEYYTDMKIVGMIEETAVGEQMQIYYHKPTIDSHFQKLFSKNELLEQAELYMLKVEEADVVSTYQEIQQSYPHFTLYNSMIYEHDARIMNFERYQIVYYIIFAVFYCFSVLFYLYYQIKEMNVYMAQYVTLHICGVKESMLANNYRVIKWLHHIKIALLPVVFLSVSNYFVDMSIILLTLLLLFIVCMPMIMILLMSLRLKKSSFSAVLQRDKDQK